MTLKIVIFLFVFLNLSIPGGDIFGINLKLILLATFLLPLVLSLFHITKLKRDPVFIISALLFLWILLSSLLSFLNDTRTFYILMELRVIIPVVVIVGAFWLLFEKNNDLERPIISFVAISLVTFSLYKIFLELCLVFGILSIEDIFSISDVVGGNKPVHSPMPFNMVRLFWTKPDFILSLSPIFILTFFKKINLDKWVYPALSIIAIAVVIGFSRALMVCFAMMLIMGLLIRNGWKDTIIKASVGGLLLLIFFGKQIITLLAHRFSSEYTGNGDEKRVEQMLALLDHWSNHLWFGSGIGSNANYIRVPEYPFSYELYLLSFFMKTGLVGLILFSALLFVINYKLVELVKLNKNLANCDTYLVLLLSINFAVLLSFTNQFLPSTVTGTYFGILLYLSRAKAFSQKNGK